VTFVLTLDADGENQVLQLRVNINRPPVLLVLDNTGSHWSDRLVEVMQQSGYAYDVFDAAESGTPAIDDLAPYHVVMWTAGSYYGTRVSGTNYEPCLNSAEIAVMSDFVEAGGRLGLFAQDYFYDVGLDAFLQNQMRVATVYNADSGCTSIVGDPGGPLSTFAGTAREWFYYDFTDRVMPGAEAGLLMADPDGHPVAIYRPDGGPWAYEAMTTYSAFGIERFDDASLLDFLQQWLAWMRMNPSPEVPLPTSPSHGQTVGSSNIGLTWTDSDYGEGYIVQVATDLDFTNTVFSEFVDFKGTCTVPSLDEGTHYWRVAVDGGVEPYRQGVWSPRATFVVEEAQYLCGDVDNNGTGPDISDLVYLVNYMFKQGPDPVVEEAADVNSSGGIDIQDLVYLVNYMFKQGPEPDCP
jgi:hypothetical protein